MVMTLITYTCAVVPIPDFAQALQRRQQMIKADAAIMQTLAQSETIFRVNNDQLLSLRETDDGYDYMLYHPELHSSVEDSICFEDLSDYHEDFPDDPPFALLTRAVCDHFRLDWSETEFTVVNPNHERNFSIEATRSGFQVHSTSELFGTQAVVFQSPIGMTAPAISPSAEWTPLRGAAISFPI